MVRFPQLDDKVVLQCVNTELAHLADFIRKAPRRAGESREAARTRRASSVPLETSALYGITSLRIGGIDLLTEPAEAEQLADGGAPAKFGEDLYAPGALIPTLPELQTPYAILPICPVAADGLLALLTAWHLGRAVVYNLNPSLYQPIMHFEVRSNLVMITVRSHRDSRGVTMARSGFWPVWRRWATAAEALRTEIITALPELRSSDHYGFWLTQKTTLDVFEEEFDRRRRKGRLPLMGSS